jgi:hypothetical protein
MNTSELRRILIEDLHKLRSGQLTPNEARARGALVRPIIDTMKLELLHEAMHKPHVQPLTIAEEEDERKVVGLPRR